LSTVAIIIENVIIIIGAIRYTNKFTYLEIPTNFKIDLFKIDSIGSWETYIKNVNELK